MDENDPCGSHVTCKSMHLVRIMKNIYGLWFMVYGFGSHSVFLRFKKFGGHFDPLGLGSGGHFQILGVISYIMYILLKSDVNKNATPWGVLLWSQKLVYAENTIFQSNFHAELRYACEVFWLEIPVENILISVFWIDWESGRFLYFKSGTNLVTDRILRRLWIHGLTCA